jgi:signal transduction histidine kinase
MKIEKIFHRLTSVWLFLHNNETRSQVKLYISNLPNTSMRRFSCVCLILFTTFVCYSQTDSLLIKEAASSNQRAKDLVSSKKYKDAIPEFQKAIEKFSQSRQVKSQLASFYGLAEAYYLNYNDSLALVTLESAEELSKSSQDTSMLCKLYVRHANYLYKLGFNQQALAMNHLTITLARQCHDIVNESYARSNMGLVLKDMGKYDESLTAMFETLKIRESNPAFSKKDVSSILLNIGYVLDVLKRSDEAIGYYRRALQLKIEDADSMGMSRVYSNIAVIYKNRKEYQTALQYIDSSNFIIQKAGLDDEFYVNYTNMGSIYKRMGDPAKGELYYKKALDIAVKIQSVQYEGDTYLNLATLFYEQKSFDKSIAYLKKALTLTDYTNSPLSKFEVYGSLSEAYAGAGNMNEAYRNLLLCNQYRDSVFQKEQLKVIEETKAGYETEKKEQQIVLQQSQLSEQHAQLARTNIIIGSLILSVVLVVIILLLIRSRLKRKQQLLQKEHELSLREAYIEASIQSQENERKRFAQDLHDGMGQLISSLRLALNPINKNTTQEDRVKIVSKAEDLLTDMHREIRSIAFNLMPHTLIQYGLVPALKEMTDRVMQSGNIIVRVSSFDIPERLKEVQEISLYRIIQEWINNVMKYADASLIEIQLVGHEKEITLTIEDNGEGFDADTLKLSAGNGWRNIQSRLNLIKGSLEIDSQKGKKGTTLIMKIATQVESVSVVTAEA